MRIKRYGRKDRADGRTGRKDGPGGRTDRAVSIGNSIGNTIGNSIGNYIKKWNFSKVAF